MSHLVPVRETHHVVALEMPPDTVRSPGEERAALARLIGFDEGTVSDVHAIGIRATNIALLEWLPAVDIAWQNGLDAIERADLRNRFDASGPATASSSALLESWLATQPTTAQFDAGRRALTHWLAALGPATRQAVARSVVARCESARRASGNTRGPAETGTDEERRLNVIREALEVET